MSDKNIDLSIIIVSYNTADFLVNSIRSIVKSVKKTSYEIIIVDNASIDNTIEKTSSLKLKASDFKIIRNDKNLGFSKANNIGVKESSGKYVLFLNPDTLVYERAIDGMIAFMDKQKDAGASTCFIKLPNGKLDDAAHRGFPTPWRALCHFSGMSKLFPRSKLLNGYSLGWQKINKIHEIDSCAGAFMLVKRNAGEEIGWWDEDFFWYGEDIDFCYRLKKRGWKIYFVPDFEILHYKGVSGGIKKISNNLSTADSKTRTLATKARFDAMRIFYGKHYKNHYPGWLSSIVLLGIDIKHYFSKLSNKL